MLLRFSPDVIAPGAKVVVAVAGTTDIANSTGPMTGEQIEGRLASMADLHPNGRDTRLWRLWQRPSSGRR